MLVGFVHYLQIVLNIGRTRNRAVCGDVVATVGCLRRVYVVNHLFGKTAEKVVHIHLACTFIIVGLKCNDRLFVLADTLALYIHTPQRTPSHCHILNYEDDNMATLNRLLGWQVCALSLQWVFQSPLQLV